MTIIYIALAWTLLAPLADRIGNQLENRNA